MIATRRWPALSRACVSAGGLLLAACTSNPTTPAPAPVIETPPPVIETPPPVVETPPPVVETPPSTTTLTLHAVLVADGLVDGNRALRRPPAAPLPAERNSPSTREARGSISAGRRDPRPNAGLLSARHGTSTSLPTV